MSRGKIRFTPPASGAVTLDEAHYLSIDEAAFNFGISDFAIDALLYVESDAADEEGWICAKGAIDLDGEAGWHFFYEKSGGRLGLRINDGAVAATVAYSHYGAFSPGSWFWARVNADRDGAAEFFVNGAVAGAGNIAAAAGSVDNAEYFKVGAYDAATNRLKGAIDFLRVDVLRLLRADWAAAEWLRIKYGATRRPEDFPAFWDFTASLADASANRFTLAWQGGGDAAYQDGWPYAAAPVEYVFGRNFRPEPELGHAETDDVQMALNGRSFSHAGPRLRRGVLEFPAADLEQAVALTAVWEGGREFWLHLDADRPGFKAVMLYPPVVTPITANLWTVSLEYRETI